MRRTNMLIHLVLVVLTAGLWIVPWMFLAVASAATDFSAKSERKANRLVANLLLIGVWTVLLAWTMVFLVRHLHGR